MIKKDIKNIIFDYDGTLHNSIKIYKHSFEKAYKYLVEEGLAKERKFTEEGISKWLGFSSKEMWNEFMPQLDDSKKLKASSIIGSNMIKLIKENKAELYCGALDTLKYLKDRGYNLIFLSNCRVDYMNLNREKFKLDLYFNDYYCTEQFDFKAKYKIFEDIKKKYIGDFIIIGDRYLDIEVGIVHNIRTIGCKYGFAKENELNKADILIDNINELKDIL